MVLMYSHVCEMTNCNGHIRELIECCPYILINTTLDIRCAHTHGFFEWCMCKAMYRMKQFFEAMLTVVLWHD